MTPLKLGTISRARLLEAVYTKGPARPVMSLPAMESQRSGTTANPTRNTPQITEAITAVRFRPNLPTTLPQRRFPRVVQMDMVSSTSDAIPVEMRNLSL
ncbi:hypothetical protein ES703_64269 [subsurface metagenome]